MSLHIILGLADTKPTTEPAVVYCGRSGAKARAALATSPHPRHLVFANPQGIPKSNPRASANVAAHKASFSLEVPPERGAPFDEALPVPGKRFKK